MSKYEEKGGAYDFIKGLAESGEKLGEEDYKELSKAVGIENDKFKVMYDDYKKAIGEGRSDEGFTDLRQKMQMEAYDRTIGKVASPEVKKPDEGKDGKPGATKDVNNLIAAATALIPTEHVTAANTMLTSILPKMTTIVEALSSGKGIVNISVTPSVKGEEFASALIDGRYLDGTKFTTINDNTEGTKS